MKVGDLVIMADWAKPGGMYGMGIITNITREMPLNSDGSVRSKNSGPWYYEDERMVADIHWFEKDARYRARQHRDHRCELKRLMTLKRADESGIAVYQE